MVGRVLIACLVLAAGCEKRSTLYCSKNPEDLANCEQTDAMAPVLVSCTTAPCSLGYCEPSAQVCVECYENSHCPDGELCDSPGTYTCRGCIGDADCPGGTCLPGGSCGNDDTVIYVDGQGTDNPNCTIAAPCLTIDHGLTLVEGERKYMRLTGELTESPTIAVAVEIIAHGAKLSGEIGPDWVIKIGAVVVKIHGLEIYCAGGADQAGVAASGAHTTTLDGVEIHGCGRGGGVESKMGFLNIQRSNIHDCSTGGIKTDGGARFSITNTFLHHNGTAMIGAAKFDNTEATDRRFEFNTVVSNPAGGIECKTAFPLPNNIIAANGLVLSDNVVVCDASMSLVTDNLVPLAFKNTTGMGVPPYDYHIDEASTAKDNAPAQSNIIDDFDGDIRPQDAAKDYGADEYRGP